MVCLLRDGGRRGSRDSGRSRDHRRVTWSDGDLANRAHSVASTSHCGRYSRAMTETVERKPRARDLGIAIGTMQPGPRNAITDVAGVGVGHATIIDGDSVRTGVTVVVPH